MNCRWISLSWVAAWPAVVIAGEAHQLVEQANRAFENQEYSAALEAYREAEVTLPESAELAFNQGVAHYKLGDLNEARENFNRALSTRDLQLEAKVKFNLGNVAYASALEKLSNLEEAIEHIKTAIGQYRDVLELNPDDEDAKANIQSAQLLIKDLLDKLKKQQEEKQQDQPQDNEQQQQDQNKSQEGSEQESSDQQQPQEGEQEQSSGDESQDQPEQQEHQSGQQDEPPRQDQQDQADGSQPQAQPREMTQEEVDRLLQAVRDREHGRREEKARRVPAHWAPVERDW